MSPTLRARARRAYLAVRQTGSLRLIESRLGTETTRVVDLATLGIQAPDRVRYEPSGWLDLRRILPRGDVSRDDVFLDYGSGKGRVILQAAQYDFKRVIGVELSPELSRAAARNVEARRSSLRCQAVECVVADASEYELPDDVTVAYLYNPFRGDTFSAVVERIVDSLDRAPRRLRVVYRTPLEEHRLLQSGRFALVKTASGLRPGREWSRKMSIRMYVSV
jgi:SAM-dependent methyltransferase